LFAPTVAEKRTARVMGGWFLGTFVGNGILLGSLM
jgi:hypothetical protein